LAAHLQAVDVRQLTVKHDHMRYVTRNGCECLLAAGRGPDPEVGLLECSGKPSVCVTVSVDHENVHRDDGSGATKPR
jgi:hypothetical protein